MIDTLARTRLLLGDENVEKLKKKTVMVLGLGGVGSHLTEALARSGVGRLILIDHDTVSLTNINRQSIAYHSTIGQYKTKLMKNRIADILPDIHVKTKELFILPENVDAIFDEEMDYVADAIDTVTAKLDVAERAIKKGIPIISCMGTGNKLYPEMFEITDISKTSMDPLSRVMRRELKNRGIYHMKVLYSKEKPINIGSRGCTGEEKGKKRAIPGSVAFVPPVAGMMIAGEIIRDMTNLNESEKERDYGLI